MAEYVGLSAQRPDTFGKLSQLLAIRGQQAEVKSAQQSQRQRAALAKFASEGGFDRHLGEDGTPDINSIMADPELQAAAGDQIQDVLGKVVALKQGMLQNMGTLVQLRGGQREAFGELMNGLRGDPDVAADNDSGRQKVNQGMLQFGEMYGEDAYPVLSAYSRQIQSTPKGKLGDALKIIGMQAQAVGNQMAAQQPAYQGTGGRFEQVNPNALPTSAPSLAATIPPGFDVVTDPRTGNPYTVDRQTRRTQDLGSAGPNAPPGSPSSIPRPFYPGQSKDIEGQQTDVANIRQAADQAPLQRSVYQKILKLSDATNTGQFTAWLQSNPVIGQIAGDSYQELGKYLEKNAISNMQAMGGPPYDARLSAATAANGSTKFNPQALKEVTRFNYATNTALEAFRQGIDNAVGTSNPDYSALPRFRSEWAKNFDIDVFRLENAINDGDEATKNKLLEGLSPAQAGVLMDKRKNLDALRNTGRMP